MSQRHYEETELGDELGPLVKEPTREQIRDYVSLSEIRLGGSPAKRPAQGEGLRGIIVPGNMSMSFLSQLLTDWAGMDGRLAKLEVNFPQDGGAGRQAGVQGVVTDMQEVDGQNVVTLDAFIENQKGERPIQGIAEVVLPSTG